MNELCGSAMAGALRRIFLLALVLCFGFFAVPGRAALISAGTPITGGANVPPALDDPFLSLVSPLPANQILVPIQITGANGLQDWSFDLTFDDSVVVPLDVGGVFQNVYAAHFNAVNSTLSGITGSGFFLPDVLQGIAGFSLGVSGDGLLAFALFQRLGAGDPDFDIANQNVTQQAPSPGTLLLLVPALAALRLRRAIVGKAR